LGRVPGRQGFLPIIPTGEGEMFSSKLKVNSKRFGHKVLLVNPPMEVLYEKAKVKSSVPTYPPLNLALLAGSLRPRGYEVAIFDMLPEKKTLDELLDELEEFIRCFSPTVVGITATTPVFDELKKIASRVKKHNTNILTVGGGAHLSSLPEWAINNAELDFGIIGEGEVTFPGLLSTDNPASVPGIVYKEEGRAKVTGPIKAIQDLDELPKPAWDIIELSKYRVPKTLARKSPVAGLETSRGCPYGCIYCCKSVFGRTYRVKSPRRVLEEVRDYAKAGFKEIHILDDVFAYDRERAIEICRLIKEEGLDIAFCAANGLRADNVDRELLSAMKEAGFYRVAFGVETGDPDVLKRTKKGIKMDEIRRGIKLAKEAGLETMGYFMFGLPGETEKSMQRTIDFAKELEPTIAKFNVVVPLPGTELFEQWQENLSTEWGKYGFHMGLEMLNSPELDRQTVREYYDKAYREFYWRPSYVIRQFIRSLKNRTLLADLGALISTDWSSPYRRQKIHKD
jgi:radical SAM superfamily enzyme YgiQ (UPF0313 family)